MIMKILVVYDIGVRSPGGPKRLNRVSKICSSYGFRVQNSVFECQVNNLEMNRLVDGLNDVIKPDLDSIRIYKLKESPNGLIKLGAQALFDVDTEYFI